MNRLIEDIREFLNHKIYVLSLAFTAVCSYGYAVVQPIIGIDDTAVELYLQEGLEVVMGRWTIYLINKLFYVAEFAPFMLELIGVLLLMLAATLFCVLLKRIWGNHTSMLGYVIFACVFISNPIISEVFVYYYHDGVGLGFVLIACALLTFEEALHGAKWKKLAISLLCVCLAIGCYESLIIVYILGTIVILFFQGVTDAVRLKGKYIVASLAAAAGIVVASVLLRGVIIQIMTVVFQLQGVEGLQNQRSLSEMTVLFQGKAGIETLLMLLKRYWLVYYVNAIVYLPVTGYVAAMLAVGVVSVAAAVKKRNIWYPVLFIGMAIAPFLLTLAEARVTYYRSCQYLPFFVAAAAFMLYVLLEKSIHKAKKWTNYIRYVFIAGMAVLVLNQAAYMNKCFYVDFTKYESTKETLTAAARDIERECDISKPVIFTGHYDVPHTLIEDFYVSFDSKEFALIAKITDMVDVHLKEKYYSPYGYSFAGEAYWPFIQWGFDAFDGTNREMIKFLEMHGHSFKTVQEEEVLREARQAAESMPKWPAAGSIAEQDAYIIIHF